MRIDYDEDHDTVYVRLDETPATAEGDEVEPGVIVGYGPDGQVVGFELLDARRREPWQEWARWVDALQTRLTRP
jgi:uncharacterized protein YuzE